MYGNIWPSNGTLLFIACVIGVIGWAVIESLLWLLSMVTISFNI